MNRGLGTMSASMGAPTGSRVGGPGLGALVARWWHGHRVWRRVLLAGLTSLLLVIGVVGTSTSAVNSRNGATAADEVTASCSVSAPDTAAGYEQAFAALWGSWAGGDQASTVELPDGRVLWLFGDTLQGEPGADGTVVDARMVHNSFVLQDGGCFTAVTGSSGGAVIPGPGDGTWYWPQQALVVGDELWISVLHVSGGASSTDFSLLGVSWAVFQLADGADPELVSIQDTPAVAAGDYGILWGTGLAESDGMAYVYGTRRTHTTLLGRQLLLARVPLEQLGDLSAWQYRTADGWSDQESEAVVLADGVGTSVAVVGADDGTWVVVSMRDEIGDAVVALTSDLPWGPFTQSTLFDVSTGDGELSYLPMAHPELTLADGRMLVSVSHNVTDLTTALSDGSALRPTFQAVQLPG